MYRTERDLATARPTNDSLQKQDLMKGEIQNKRKQLKQQGGDSIDVLDFYRANFLCIFCAILGLQYVHSMQLEQVAYLRWVDSEFYGATTLVYSAAF